VPAVAARLKGFCCSRRATDCILLGWPVGDKCVEVSLPLPHPKVVSKILGHASITMTLDRYSHWITSMGRHAANSMEEALG
jgi:integrase